MRFNGKMIISVVGIAIFLFAVIGRAFITSIGDIVIAPKVEMYVARVLDASKEKNYYKDTRGRTYTEYNTKLTLDLGDQVINLESNERKIYDQADINIDMKVFKYKDKYALLQEEFTLPKTLKIVLDAMIVVGLCLGFFPIVSSEAGRYGRRRRYWNN